MAANDFAIVVGLASYPGLDPILQLNGPENDAKNFAAWLADPAKGNVPPANINLIVSSKFLAPGDALDARPATVEVDSAFERLIRAGQANGGVAGRRLYIFLAGHGFAPDIEDAALLMANVDLMVGTTGHHVSGRGYARWFLESGLFSELVLFMDCCRDDMPRAPARQPPWQSIRNPRGGRSPFFYGFATEWARKAREDTLVPGGPVQGFFSAALLDALNGGAADAGGNVTSDAVKRYILHYFQTLPAFRSLPEPKLEFDSANPLLFAANVPAVLTPVQIQFSPASAAHAAEFSVLDGKFRPVADNVNGDNPWKLQLAMGQYVVGRNMAEQKQFDAVGKELIDVPV